MEFGAVTKIRTRPPASNIGAKSHLSLFSVESRGARIGSPQPDSSLRSTPSSLAEWTALKLGNFFVDFLKKFYNFFIRFFSSSFSAVNVGQCLRFFLLGWKIIVVSWQWGI